MKIFIRIIQNIIVYGTKVSGYALLVAMLIIVINVVIRSFFRKVIPDSLDLFGLIMVAVIGFAMSHTALQKGHVQVDLIASRFPPRVSTITDILVSFLSLGIWSLVTWGGINMIIENWVRDKTPVLEIPYLPFRTIWVSGLLFFSIVYIMKIADGFKRLFKR